MNVNIIVVVIALGLAGSPAGAQGQASEKALQAAFLAVQGSGWSPTLAARPIEIAAPHAVPVGYDGAQAACPKNKPFSGDWPPSLRCYYDGSGNLHHWAAIHKVTAYIGSFWFEGKTKTQDRIITGYPAFLLKQRQYNEWVRLNPRFETTMENNGSHYTPTRVPETGRLTPGTLLIPYYKSLLSYQEMRAAFITECAALEGVRGDTERSCMKWRRIESPSRIEWVPNYPNADMAEWGQSLEALDQARLRLFQRVDVLGVFPAKSLWDPLDCFGARLRRDCSLEALPQADAEAIDALTRDIATKLLRVQQIEDKRASAEPALASAAPVEWVGFAEGKFQMGSDESSLTRPRHEVAVPAFEMSKTLVTVEQFAECVRAGQCDEPDSETVYSFECNWDKPHRGCHPVNCVDWNQARQFASYHGARLPTEAEYEYAAGSGRGLIYPWGNEPPTGDRIPSSSRRSAHPERSVPVCSNPAGNTERGLCDMTGNLQAWTQDRHAFGYGSSAIEWRAEDDVVKPRENYRNPKGGHLPGRTSLQGTTSPGGPRKVVRGIYVGTDGFGGASCKNTHRSFAVSVDRFGWVGFRLARSVR